MCDYIDKILLKYRELSTDKLFENRMSNLVKENLTIYSRNYEYFAEEYCDIKNISYKLVNFILSKSYMVEEETHQYCFVLMFSLHDKTEEDRYIGKYKLILDINLGYVDDMLLK